MFVLKLLIEYAKLCFGLMSYAVVGSCLLTPGVLYFFPSTQENWVFVFLVCMSWPVVILLCAPLPYLFFGAIGVAIWPIAAVYDALTKMFLGKMRGVLSEQRIDQEWNIRISLLWTGLILSALVTLAICVAFYADELLFFAIAPTAGVALLCAYKLFEVEKDRKHAKEDCREELKGRSAICKRLAAVQYMKGDYKSAVEVLHLAKQWHPRDIWSELLHARIEKDQGRLDAALERCELVLARNERNSSALMLRGDIHLNRHEIDKSIADYGEAAGIYGETDSTKSLASFCSGLAHETADRTGEAIRAYNRSMFGKHLDDLSIIPNSPHDYLERGDAHAELNEYQLAVADYTAAIDGYLRESKNPTPDEDDDYWDEDAASTHSKDYASICYARRAWMHETLSDYDQALDDFKNAIRYSEDSAWRHHLSRASVFEMREQYEEMLQECKTSMRLNGRHSDNYLRRGRSYHYLKRYDDAIADFSKVIDPANEWLDRHSPEPHRFRAESHMAQGNYQLAIDDLTNAIKLSKNYPELYQLRAQAYNAIGAHGKAVEDLREATNVDPSLSAAAKSEELWKHKSQEIESSQDPSMSAYVERADAFTALGKFDFAIADLNVVMNSFDKGYRFKYWNDDGWSQFNDTFSTFATKALVSSYADTTDIKVLAKMRRDSLLKKKPEVKQIGAPIQPQYIAR